MRIRYKLKKHKRLFASAVAVFIAVIMLLGVAAPFLSQ